MDLSLDESELIDLYISYDNRGFNDIDMRLVSQDVYSEYHATQSIWSALFYGAVSTIIILAIITSAFVGYRAAGVFCLYMILVSIYPLWFSGEIFYLFPDIPLDRLQRFGVGTSQLISGAMLLFGYCVFDLNKINSRYSKFVLAMAMASCIGFFIESFRDYDTHIFLALLAAVILVVNLCLHAANGILALKGRQPGALPFLFSSIIFLCAAMSFLLHISQDAEFLIILRPVILMEAIAFATTMSVRAYSVKKQRNEAVRMELSLTQDRLKLTETLRQQERDFEDVRKQSDNRRAQLAAVSHDILQPLTSLRAAMSDIKYFDEDRVQRMHDAYDYLESIARDSLDQSKTNLEGIASRDGLEYFNVNILLANLSVMFAGEAQQKGLSLRCVSCDKFIVSDPVKLMRILSNLTANAIKHTSGGGVLVGCQKRGDGLRISIWDTGLGMNEAEIKTYRQAYEKNAHSSGAGLGLHIVEQLTQQLGHILHIKSVLGRGTQMSILVVGSINSPSYLPIYNK